MMKKKKIAIHGFGRIGRTVLKHLLQRSDVEVVWINDRVPDTDNLVYLYNFDSTYGRAEVEAHAYLGYGTFGEGKIDFLCHESLREVDWKKYQVDILVDATGSTPSLLDLNWLCKNQIVQKAIVTRSPLSGVDKTLILGVNEKDYNPSCDHVVAASICDANAIAPILSFLDRCYGLESGWVTTLHPWLSYQNLMDAPVWSQHNPGHTWKDYSLGRASIGALIPKNTTAVSALEKVLPEIAAKMDAISYRVPTETVASCDLSLSFRKPVLIEDLKLRLEELASGNPYVSLNHQSLVSLDYKKQNHSVSIDMQWLKVLGQHSVKLVGWYDNEWGYSARVSDLVGLLATSLLHHASKPRRSEAPSKGIELVS